MLRKLALVFGIVFVIIGIGGFLPFLVTKDSMGMNLLLGLFMVGGVHNVIHIASGIGALIGSTNTKYARLYFQIFGIVYGIVTIIGFIQGNTVLGIFPVNLADNFLHLIITAVSLYLGFGFKSED